MIMGNLSQANIKMKLKWQAVVQVKYRLIFFFLILYLDALEIIILKIRRIGQFYKSYFFVKTFKKSACLNWTYGHSGNDYGVAAPFIVTVFTMQSLKSIGQL